MGLTVTTGSNWTWEPDQSFINESFKYIISMNNNFIFSVFFIQGYRMALEALEYNMVFVKLKGLVPFYEIL